MANEEKFDELSLSPQEFREYRKGQQAYYDNPSTEETFGTKTSSKSDMWTKGWLHAQGETEDNKNS